MIFLYLFLLFLIGGLVGYALNRHLIHLESHRKGRVENIEHFEAVDTPHEMGEDLNTEKKRALIQVGKRYSIIRRVLTFFLIGVIFFWALVPLISESSATLVSVIAGAVSVIVGIASRPFLENFISGIVLSFSNRLRVGDTVYIDGNLGSVEDITVTHSVIRLWNWQRYITPNQNMLNKSVINCSHKDKLLWTHVEFHCSYQVSESELNSKLLEAISTSQYLYRENVSELWPMELLSSGVKYWLAAWADGPEDAWFLRIDMRRAILQVFEDQGWRSHLHLHSFDGEASSGNPSESPDN